MFKRLMLVVLFLIPGPAAGAGFLIPCAAFSRLRIEPGAWCRYLVIEGSMERRDSSELYVSLPKGEPVADGFFWFEIEGIPRGEDERDHVVARLLVSRTISGTSCIDTISNYIATAFISRGGEEPHEEDPGLVDELEMGGRKEEAQWTLGEQDTVSVMGRSFVCKVERRAVKSSKEILMKHGRLFEKRSEEEKIWFSDEVPLFGLVRYAVRRDRSTAMDPPVAGVPVSGNRTSETLVELIAFGEDATTILPLSSVAGSGGEGR